MESQFIEAMFQFEEELAKQSIAVNDASLSTPNRCGRLAEFLRPILLINIDVQTDSNHLEGF